MSAPTWTRPVTTAGRPARPAAGPGSGPRGRLCRPDVFGRALTRLRSAGIGCIPLVHHTPDVTAGQPRPRAASGVPALAARRHHPLVAASSRIPAGREAHSLIEATAVHGGPFVHAIAPARRMVAVAGARSGSAGLSPPAVRTVRSPAERHLPVTARPKEA